MDVITLLSAYFISVNLLGFALWELTNTKQKREPFRIPEATLFLIALIGGSIGSIIGMYAFRHKTRHWYFLYGMPAILLIQILIVVALISSPIEFMIL